MLLILALTAPVSGAQVSGAAQSGSSVPPHAPTLQECEVNPNTPGCEQSSRPTVAPGHLPALSNTVNAPVSVATGPARTAEKSESPANRSNSPETPTEFQLMVASSVGRMLPIYGRSLFRQPPSTFAPLVNVPVPAKYVIGPGDELYVQIWGQINVEFHAAVDRDGAIYIPKVGSIIVAGVHYEELNGFLRQQIARIYRNFDVAVTLGRLRSIDIYVTGEALAPGRYTISSLSTLINAVFVTGGPSLAGSMRHIELKRAGKVVTDFDMYDLLLNGDTSQDAPLLPGDVIYIPPVGSQIAVAGSVNVPAIYELKNAHDNLADAIALAGGLNQVADQTRMTVERIEDHEVRSVAEFSYRQSESEQVSAGDIIHVLSIVPRFDNAVTLRGNVANPGRYRWRQGMRIRDLIPNKESLLTRNYWQSENNLVNGKATEYESLEPAANASSLRTEVKLAAPEINWDYAVIERLDPVDLSTRLIPFSLRKAVLENDPSSNLLLEPGDIVTIFSQRDIAVPQKEQTIFVRVEGEVKSPGIYRIQHGQTLQGLLRMAGGLTANAYLYGAQFTRQSARVDQQAALQRTAAVMQQQFEEMSIANYRSNPTQVGAIGAQSQAQEALLRELQTAKATGRVILALKPADHTIAAVPSIVLEDADSILIPPNSQVVSVVGSVFDQSSFVYRKGATVNYYLHQAGNGNENADMKHILLVRANGSVISGSFSEYGWWRANLKSMVVLPGDTIVIPPKLKVGGFGKAIEQWATVASQASISAAVIATH
jgi:protein involved in polysaccharide export with SLBB domain